MEISLFNSLKFSMPLLVLSAIVPLISLASFYATKTSSKTINQEAKENLAVYSTCYRKIFPAKFPRNLSQESVKNFVDDLT